MSLMVIARVCARCVGKSHCFYTYRKLSREYCMYVGDGTIAVRLESETSGKKASGDVLDKYDAVCCCTGIFGKSIWCVMPADAGLVCGLCVGCVWAVFGAGETRYRLRISVTSIGIPSKRINLFHQSVGGVRSGQPIRGHSTLAAACWRDTEEVSMRQSTAPSAFCLNFDYRI